MVEEDKSLMDAIQHDISVIHGLDEKIARMITVMAVEKYHLYPDYKIREEAHDLADLVDRVLIHMGYSFT